MNVETSLTRCPIDRPARPMRPSLARRRELRQRSRHRVEAVLGVGVDRVDPRSRSTGAGPPGG